MKTTRALAIAAAFTALAAGVRATTTTIDQEGQKFSEKSVTVAVGDTLRFQNNDTVRHNLRILNEADDVNDLGLQEPGAVLTYQAAKSGKFRARCGIHPSMKLAINVN